MKKYLIWPVLLIAGSFSLLIAGGDAAAGKASYVLCATCHGQNGEGNVALNSPAIAGQESWYLVRQMKSFKDGLRGTNPKDIYGMQMKPMAMTIADEQTMENLAAFIQNMKPEKQKDTLGGDAAKGKAIYAGLCATCHGPKGEGMQAMNSPKVYLQQDWYLERQLKNFKDGIRGADPKDIFGMQMRPMAMTLADDQAIKDVIAYMLSLGPK